MDHHPDDWTFGRVLEERQMCVRACACVQATWNRNPYFLSDLSTSNQFKAYEAEKRLMVTTYNLSQEDGMATNLILRF